MKKPNKRKLSLAVALYLAASVNFSAADAMTTSDVGFDGKNIFEIYPESVKYDIRNMS